MNFLGMGMWEIMIIMIVALVIFGPGKLPEVAGQVGRAVRDFRRMTTELTTEFEQTAGVKELKNEIAGIRSELTGATEGVKREMSSVAKTANKSVSSAKAAATAKKPATTTSTANKTTTATKSNTSSTTASKSTSKAAGAKPNPVASKADPLADVSFLDEAVTAAPVLRSNGHMQQDTTVPSSDVTVVGTTSSTSIAADDALTRARRRRLQAGYGRPHI